MRMLIKNNPTFLFGLIPIILNMGQNNFRWTLFKRFLLSLYYNIDILIVLSTFDSVIISDSTVMLTYTTNRLKLANI